MAKQYQVVPGNDEDDVDLELGEGVGAQTNGTTSAKASRSLDEEVDNWDENVEDNWDDDVAEGDGHTPSASSNGDNDGKKRGL